MEPVIAFGREWDVGEVAYNRLEYARKVREAVTGEPATLEDVLIQTIMVYLAPCRETEPEE
jgi:hypothetical protein